MGIALKADGGFRGGGGVAWVIFYDIQLRPTDPKTFLKATSTPMYTDFDGELAQKTYNFFKCIWRQYILISRGAERAVKLDFLVNFLPKTACFECLFKSLPAFQLC